MPYITSALIEHYDHTPFWIPGGTNKDDLECQIHLKVRLVYGTLDVRLLRGSDSTIRIGIWGRRGSGLRAGGPNPSPCGQLTRCFSAVAELLVSVSEVFNSRLDPVASYPRLQRLV